MSISAGAVKKCVNTQVDLVKQNAKRFGADSFSVTCGLDQLHGMVLMSVWSGSSALTKWVEESHDELRQFINEKRKEESGVAS